MNSSFQRTDRVSDVLKKEIAVILAREVKDPRLQLVTITHVSISRDLRNARVYYSTIDQGEEREAVSRGLRHASGFVQRKLGSRIKLRNTPHITFVYDSTLETGSRMDGILKTIEEELSTRQDDADDA